MEEILKKKKILCVSPKKRKMDEKKERANALLRRIWSNRKYKEIMYILRHYDPSNEQRCYLGGFLRYGVGLSVKEILEICDAYASWVDYDRYKTAYHLRHIEHRSKRSPDEDEQSESSSLYLLDKQPEDAKRLIEIPDSAGFVMGWVRIEGKLG